MSDGPMGDAVAELVVDDITVRYGAEAALDRFSLEAEAGEIVAVVGPSGSGKSTLLRAVAGLEPLAGGRILLNGRDLAGVPTHRRGLGLMFQDHGLFSHLNVADNISYGLRTAGATKARQRERVAELLDLIGLAGFGSRRTDQLSGGEAQRVALARALAPEPGLLMLDEPLGSLDRALRDQLTGDLRRLLTELGQTALHVTHDQAEAFAIADRVAVVSAGRVVALGTPAELWADPGTRFVADFLGHTNIWSVTVDADGTVALAGRDLGRLPGGHPLLAVSPGRHEVVMPMTGIGLVATGSRQDGIEARVEDTVFRRGVQDVSAYVSAADGGRESMHFSTVESVRSGGDVTLMVDVAALRPLVDRA